MFVSGVGRLYQPAHQASLVTFVVEGEDFYIEEHCLRQCTYFATILNKRNRYI